MESVAAINVTVLSPQLRPMLAPVMPGSPQASSAAMMMMMGEEEAAGSRRSMELAGGLALRGLGQPGRGGGGSGSSSVSRLGSLTDLMPHLSLLDEEAHLAGPDGPAGQGRGERRPAEGSEQSGGGGGGGGGDNGSGSSSSTEYYGHEGGGESRRDSRLAGSSLSSLTHTGIAGEGAGQSYDDADRPLYDVPDAGSEGGGGGGGVNTSFYEEGEAEGEGEDSHPGGGDDEQRDQEVYGGAGSEGGKGYLVDATAGAPTTLMGGLPIHDHYFDPAASVGTLTPLPPGNGGSGGGPPAHLPHPRDEGSDRLLRSYSHGTSLLSPSEVGSAASGRGGLGGHGDLGGGSSGVGSSVMSEGSPGGEGGGSIVGSSPRM